MKKLDAEAIQAIADAKWWREMLPDNWQLVGFNYRHSVSAYDSTKRLVNIDGQLLIDLHAKYSNKGQTK
jgi:hypothetical protein